MNFVASTFTNGALASFAKRRAISVLPTPVGPIIKIFTAKLPLLDNLRTFLPRLDAVPDGKVTLVDLLALKDQAGNFEFIGVVSQILDVIGLLADLSSGDLLDYGDIALSEDALAAIAAGETSDGLEDVFSVSGFAGATFGELAGFESVAGALDDLGGFGLDIPLLTSSAPEAIGEILLSGFLGRPVSLVQFNLPELALDRDIASFFFSIPIGPFAFVLEGGFGAAFNINVGYSTDGFLQNGDLGGAILDGLYLAPPTGPNGELLPVAEFSADLSAGFGISVPGLRVTIDGGFLGVI